MLQTPSRFLENTQLTLVAAILLEEAACLDAPFCDYATQRSFFAFLFFVLFLHGGSAWSVRDGNTLRVRISVGGIECRISRMEKSYGIDHQGATGEGRLKRHDAWPVDQVRMVIAT